jgi:enediyne polyketide synthase
MACIYPGALSPEELWENVLAGRREFRRLPDERLPMRDYYDEDPSVPGKTYGAQMAVITRWMFEPTEFGIPPVTVRTSDVTHWLALHTAREALRDAGVDLERVDRTRIGVILGDSGGEFARAHILRNRWPFVERAVRRAVAKTLRGATADSLVEAIRHFYEGPLPAINEDHLAGNMTNVTAGRLCNHFDLRGGGYTVDGACASSLLAVAHGCNALVNGELDLVLAGGVDVSLDPFEIVGFAKTKALAKDDIRPYDARGAGMITGEGCGIVVLAREDHARAAGHRPRALVKGWGISSDGSGGITAPKVEGQMLAVQRAYERAGHSINSVALFEGHGTGTALGDKVEITALRRVMAASPGEGSARIGSIKANIGHTKAAAGAAGLIKAIMALDRKVLPPTVACRTFNPAFGDPVTDLRPSIVGAPWRAEGQPRRASVSAMGFGGVNTHLALEEADPGGEPPANDLALLASAQSSELVLLSGHDREQLAAKIERLLPIARRISRAELIDLAAALARRPPAGAFRVAVVAESPWQLASALERARAALAAGTSLDGVDDRSAGLFAGAAHEAPRVAALFPGQAAQRIGMAEAWDLRYPFARVRLDALDAEAARATGTTLRERIFRDLAAADERTRKRWAAELKETHVQQPAVVAASLLALEVLSFLGIVIDDAVGHSLGEISALCAAGVLDPGTAVRIAALRGAAMRRVAGADPGGMVALAAPPDRAEALIAREGLRLVVSNFNSPRQTVVSGDTAAIEALLRACERAGVRATRLAVSHAFHSDIVAPAADELRAALAGVEVAPPTRVQVFSTATGGPLPDDADVRELLARHVRQPVRFSEAVAAIAKREPALWVEVGPGGILSALVRDNVGPAAECFPMDLDGEDSFDLLNRLAARAFVRGVRFSPERLFEHRLVRAFDPERYEPTLIVNPCEREVAPPRGELELGTGLEGSIAPAEAGSPEFATYLGERGSYLRDLISLDYRHHRGGGAGPPATEVVPAPGPGVATAPAAAETGRAQAPAPAIQDEAAALALAIDWIAERTGFARDFISPDKRLRDDLNLDSIKSGELVLTLSRALGAQMPLDPGVLANATVRQLVSEIRGYQGARAPEAGTVASTWIRTLAVERVPASLEGERALPELGGATGPTVVVGDPGCARAGRVAERLAAEGLRVARVDAEGFLRGGPEVDDPAALVVILPHEERRFDACTPDEFEARVPGLAERLFRIFRKAIGEPALASGELRAVVLRPAGPAGADPGVDLDAGAGFLKTLSLEHRTLSFKWVTLPASWTAERFAATGLEELRTASERVEFHHDADGKRTTSAAVAREAAAGPGPRLGGMDTVLVSGGAKGITFALALELARGTGVKLGLLGSSAAGDPEVAQNLEKLSKEGIRHVYLSCDVTRRDDVRRAVTEVERRLGAVTGILHGAGVSKFATFREMDLATYLRGIRVKVDGLHHLLGTVALDRLKIVHATSSVLGRTGMQRQADYAFANAWLDGAVGALKAATPALHALTVGYSIWEDTGMGAKTGALDTLRSVGVTSIPVATGTGAYLALVKQAPASTAFVVTGKLTTDLEARLAPPLAVPAWRFLEKVLRFVPGIELVAEARLSHDTDLYLAEHVFDRTPVFPGVMGLEAMAQAAMACAGRRDETPAFREIRFRKPIIVPDGAEARLRVYAVADEPRGGALTVQVSVRSDADGFEGEHFSAECVFGGPDAALPVAPPSIPAPLDEDPERFSPVPLFQGKFFRRIVRIRKRAEGEESITDVRIPVGAVYYAGHDSTTVTPSPAARDAFMQSGAIIMPPGCLVERIEALRFHRRPADGEELLCWVRTRPRQDGTLTADVTLYGADGGAVESMQGLVATPPATGLRVRAEAPAPLPRLAQIGERLLQACPAGGLALGAARHDEVLEVSAEALLPARERERIVAGVPAVRRTAVLAAALAAKRAAAEFFRAHRATDVAPGTIALRHLPDGKPQLALEGPGARLAPPAVSLSDDHGLTVALTGPEAIGIDLELVTHRDAETWRGLLGGDGYALALALSRSTGESFDVAATRVWGLIEAGKKALGLRRVVPAVKDAGVGGWLRFAHPEDPGIGMMSVLCEHEPAGGRIAALSVVGRCGEAADA